MKISNIILSTAVVIFFTGCASLFVPDADLINKIPVMEMGSQKQKPENNEFVLHIPAGAKIPVHFAVNGDLISEPVDSKSVTRVKQELYVYKYWASLDGKNWQPTRDVIKMPITIGVDPKGGQVQIKVNLQKQ